MMTALRSELVARELSTRFAHEGVNGALVAADLAPLPEQLPHHFLRRTYISLRVTIGDDLAAVSRDVGHADINVTFRIYTHAHLQGLSVIAGGGLEPPTSRL